jgi:flotillin
LLAQAEGARAKLLAEAEGKRANLLAEAEGKTQLAEALNAYGPEAIQLLMYQAFMEQLPKVVEAAAMPLSTIDKVVLIDGGNGTGAGHNGAGTLGRYASELPLMVERMTESFAAVTGIDLKQVVRNYTGAPDEEPNGSNGRTVINPDPRAVATVNDD